jgi:manganese/iron transport system ATP-binding protein
VTGQEAGGDAVIETRGLAKAFGDRHALRGVSFAAHSGELLAVIGPNGAGKTTLIKAILGLVPIVSGRIEVLGTTPEAARARVAYVPQAEALDPQFPVSVLQVVVMGRYRAIGWGRRPSRADKAAARAALDEVGLSHRAGDRFGVLSGGQRQRVLLARAVAQEARLLLLDEPFTGVDATTTDSVLAVLHRLRRAGVAVVMSTHDLSVAHLACDEACLINRHQVAFGPVEDALTPELLKATYGGAALLLDGGATVIAR